MTDMERDEQELMQKLEELMRKHFPDYPDKLPELPFDDDDLDLDELDNHITLTDEDGNDITFEFLDVVEYGDHEYVILLPIEDMEGGEVVIMRVDEKDGEEIYEGVDNEEEASAVFEAFREKAKDDFTFL